MAKRHTGKNKGRVMIEVEYQKLTCYQIALAELMQAALNAPNHCDYRDILYHARATCLQSSQPHLITLE